MTWHDPKKEQGNIRERNDITPERLNKTQSCSRRYYAPEKYPPLSGEVLKNLVSWRKMEAQNLSKNYISDVLK
jgi:hypothetical protein